MLDALYLSSVSFSESFIWLIGILPYGGLTVCAMMWMLILFVEKQLN